jgi:hypothetical protein
MDFYNIINDWEKCKILTVELEKDVGNFLQHPISRKLCIIARKKSKDIEKLGKRIKKNIIRQRQDNQSDYS